MTADDDDYTVDYNRSIALSNSGQREGALVAINRAIKRWPRNGFAYLQRARLLEEGNQLAEALADYTRVIELLPDTVWPSTQSAEALERDERLRAYWRRGFVRSDLGDEAGAKQDWVSAAERGYPEAVAYFARCRAKDAAVGRLAELQGERDGFSVYDAPAEAFELLTMLAQTPGEGVTARLNILLYTVLVDAPLNRALLAKLRPVLHAYVDALSDRSTYDASLLIYCCACMEAVLGDRPRALALLAEAKRLGRDLSGARNDSDFASLHRDPEFIALTAS